MRGFPMVNRAPAPTPCTPPPLWPLFPPQSNGYGIAIASANGDESKIKPVLRDKIDGNTFNDAFFNSAAFQIGESYKTYELQRIARYYNTQTPCIMFFDDGEHDALGMRGGLGDSGKSCPVPILMDRRLNGRLLIRQRHVQLHVAVFGSSC